MVVHFHWKKFDQSLLYFLPDGVTVDLYMLRSFMEDGVISDFYGRCVVTIDNSGLRGAEM